MIGAVECVKTWLERGSVFQMKVPLQTRGVLTQLQRYALDEQQRVCVRV